MLDDESYETVAATAAPPFGVTVNELVVSVLASTAREKVALTVVERATEVAPAAGNVEVTDSGAGGLAQVVNDHVTGLESGTPSAAVTAVESRAVYVVERARDADGVRVAVLVVSSYAIVAATAPPGPVNVKLELLSVLGSTDREKTAFGAIAGLTFVDVSAGVVEVTWSGTATRVVNDHDAGALIGVPSDAFAAVEIVAVYVVPKSSAALGATVAVAVVLSYETAAGTRLPSGRCSVKLEVVIVDGSIAREKRACGWICRETPVSPAAGL